MSESKLAGKLGKAKQHSTQRIKEAVDGRGMKEIP